MRAAVRPLLPVSAKDMREGEGGRGLSYLEDWSREYARPSENSPQPALPPQLKPKDDELILLFWSLAEKDAVMATHGSLAVPATGRPPEPASVPLDFPPTPNTGSAWSAFSSAVTVPTFSPSVSLPSLMAPAMTGTRAGALSSFSARFFLRLSMLSARVSLFPSIHFLIASLDSAVFKNGKC